MEVKRTSYTSSPAQVKAKISKKSRLATWPEKAHHLE
jgi:hypothetical protein